MKIKLPSIGILFLVSLIIVMPMSEVFARSRTHSGPLQAAVIGMTVLFGLIYAYYMVTRKIKLLQKTRKNLELAKANDSTWNESEFKETVQKIFYLYQDVLMNKNLDSIRDYLSPDYLERVKDDMKTTPKENKRIIKNINISSLHIVSVKDIDGKEGDMFIMEVSFEKIDYIISEYTGEFIESTLDRSKRESDESYYARAKTEEGFYTEFWTFIRINGKWLLKDIKIGGFILPELKEVSKKEESNTKMSNEIFFPK